MHHPLAPPTNPQPFINVKPQSNIFLIPLNNAHVGPFPPSILLAPIVAHDQTPQPTPILPTRLQPPPKTFYPTYGCQFSLRGLTSHQHPNMHLIHLI
jgi:hypothetical protein